MWLGFDVGNSNIVIGVFRNQPTPIQSWRISTHPIGTSDELRIKLIQLMAGAGISLNDIQKVAISSVVPSFTPIIQAALHGHDILVIQHDSPFSFQIAANPADQIGADRLVNAEAGVREYGTPLVIVDSGTATTLCAIDASKRYLGGAIAPGISLSMQALFKNTAQLFAVDLMPPPKAIGHNTKTAIQSGIVLGYASMIDGMISRFESELNTKQVRVIATGGVSPLLKSLTHQIHHYDPDLTLKGIYYVAKSYFG